MSKKPVERRANVPRDDVIVQAALRRPGTAATQLVRVRNLSPGGVMAEIDGPFEPGDPVELDLRGIGAVEGVVAWRVEDRIGIAFASPVDPHRAIASPATTPAPARTHRRTPAADQ